MDAIHVGRQPIFDRARRTFGYELLFRAHGRATSARIPDGDIATAHVIATTLADIGFANLVGDARAFINVTEVFVTTPELLDFVPVDRAVLEVLEDVEPTADVIDGVRGLRRRGFEVALDDFVPGGLTEPLRDHVDIVKYDLTTIDPVTLGREIETDHAAGRRVVVERLETESEVDLAMSAGADLLQGYFFCRPEVLDAKNVPANGVALVRLVAEINRPDASLGEIVELLEHDVAMSVKVLRLLNSAATGLPTRITSLGHAAVLLGRTRLRSLATLVMMTSVDVRSAELVDVTLTRAKFCELEARRSGHPNPDAAFTVGMLSLVDVLTGLTMDEVLDQISVSAEIESALVERAGPIGESLDLAERLERRDDPDGRPIAPSSFDHHQEAIAWTVDVTRSVAVGANPTGQPGSPPGSQSVLVTSRS